MNSRSSPLPSHRKKMAKDDVSYLFDSAKFRDKSTPAAQIVATATNMKGWERPIDPSFSDRVTRYESIQVCEYIEKSADSVDQGLVYTPTYSKSAHTRKHSSWVGFSGESTTPSPPRRAP